MRGWAIVVAIVATATTTSARADEPVQPPCAAPTRLVGVVRDVESYEPVGGATVMITSEVAEPAPAITLVADESGEFAQDVAPGSYTVTVYADDDVWTQAHVVVVASGGDVRVIAPMPHRWRGCTLYNIREPRPVVAFCGEPWVVVDRWLDADRDLLSVARDRTDRAWIASVASADPARAVVTIEGAPRLTGGLGVPLAFVAGVDTFTLRAPIGDAAGAGGAAHVALRGGEDDVRGAASATASSADGAEGDAVAGGPIVRDHAWWAASIVATEADPRRGSPVSTDAYARIDVARDRGNRGALIGLAQTHADGGRDAWADAAWTSKLADDRLVITAGATVESLALPAVVAIAPAAGRAASTSPAAVVAPIATTFAGGRASVTDRPRVLEDHELTAGIAAGAGTADATRYATASAFAGDTWKSAGLRVALGARGELRDFGDARAIVLAPRLAVDWYPGSDDRASLFVTAQRLSHLDDGAIGAWRAADATKFADELAVGATVAPKRHPWIAVGFAGRARRASVFADTPARGGVDAWVHVLREHFALRASATSLDRAAAVMAGYAFTAGDDGLALSLSGRAQAAHAEAGVGIAWHHRIRNNSATRAIAPTLELLDGDLGLAARLSVTAAF